ncbi:MAG: DUF1963 domain-containing protein [Halioglobus sp.]
MKKPKDKDAAILLKRQVPIRHEEIARSWLGGLPKMPEEINWPRCSDGSPLQFVAQICCDDFPSSLWGGIGPRSGWILLFIKAGDIDGFRQDGNAQVLHIDSLGPDIEPPEDSPRLRFAGYQYRALSKPVFPEVIPNYWRKWPVDLVSYEYDVEPDKLNWPVKLYISTEELYGAPVNEKGLNGRDIDLERPLTWRGASWVVEGILSEIDDSERFRRDFIGNKLGLIDDPPEPDMDEFNAEFERRRIENPNFLDGDWNHRGRARTELTKALKKERREGWFARAMPVLEAKITAQNRLIAEETKKLERDRATLEADQLKRREYHLQNCHGVLATMERRRKELQHLLESFPGQAGEQKLNAEIKQLGEAHLQWGARIAQNLKRAMQSILERNLETPISQNDWKELSAIWENERTTFWKRIDHALLTREETGLSVDRIQKMAVREDLLDIYTRDNLAPIAIPKQVREDLEEKVRFFDCSGRHQIGGQLIPVQTEPELDPSNALLFQISCDLPMGWWWGDNGILYVKISKGDLAQNRFDRLEASTECE